MFVRRSGCRADYGIGSASCVIRLESCAKGLCLITSFFRVFVGLCCDSINRKIFAVLPSFRHDFVVKGKEAGTENINLVDVCI